MDSLEDVLKGVALVTAVALWVVGFVSWFLMMLNRKENISWFEATFAYFPLPIIGKYFLSEKGIYWRKVHWFCIAAFGLIIVILGYGYGLRS